MPSNTNKKLSILYILDILQRYSDELHPLTYSDIISKMKTLYDMDCERKSVAFNIDSLIDYGYDIIKVSSGGCYLGARDFEPSEITFLIDAIFSSKMLNSKQSIDLSNKISKYLSKYQQKKYKYIYKACEISRANNKQLFYNIEIITEAIENNKQLKFHYNTYGIDGKLYPKQDGRFYLINPYFMVNNRGKYYLVCNYDHYDEIANYKIELISDIEIVDNPIKPIEKLIGFENGIDISKYINQNIYMFTGSTVSAKIKVLYESCVSQIFEWFGSDTKMYKDQNGDIIANIKAEEDSLKYWCLQFGDMAELVEPISMRNEIKNIIKDLSQRYED